MIKWEMYINIEEQSEFLEDLIYVQLGISDNSHKYVVHQDQDMKLWTNWEFRKEEKCNFMGHKIIGILPIRFLSLGRLSLAYTNMVK